MHTKDFNQWNEFKKIINEIKRPICRIREARWCSLGHNIGSEIDGKGTAYSRPVIILKFTSSNTCFCVPLTTSEKEGKYLFHLRFQNNNNKARLDQVRIIDTKRLKDRIGKLSNKEFIELEKAVKDFLF